MIFQKTRFSLFLLILLLTSCVSKKKYESLLGNKDSLFTQFQQYEKENKAQKEKIQTISDKLYKYEQELVSITNEKNNGGKKIAQLEKSLKDCNKKKNSLTKDFEDKDTLLTQLQRKRDSQQLIISSLESLIKTRPDENDPSKINTSIEIQLDSIPFENNKFDITDKHDVYLQFVANFLKQNENWMLDIVAFASRSGEEESNKSLSERRLDAVITKLLNFGVSTKRISGIANGSKEANSNMESSNRYYRKVTMKFKLEVPKLSEK